MSTEPVQVDRPEPGVHAGAALEEVLAAGGAALPRVMSQVEARMRDLTRGHGPLLEQHAGETIAAGGKRLRPLLVCLTAGVPVPESDAVVHAAVAVELIHAATLVHDDVLDHSTRRRGRPTVVAVAGPRVATATGDLLFSRAFAELAAGGSAHAVQILSRACSDLAAGELMQREDAYADTVSIERYLERCRLKTAVLFRAAAELGALAGGHAGDSRARLGEFAERIGVAFQILDDVLDVAGPPERTGKLRGTDLLDGTITLPVIVARELDDGLKSLSLRQVAGAQRAEEVCDQIAATGALEQCRTRAFRLVAEAQLLLEGLPTPHRTALSMIGSGVVQRLA